MVKFNKILKLATAYSLYAFADLRENMALRIFHALIPTLIQDIHSSQEVENIQKFMAFDLIPGAKEIFELGTKAVAYEFDCSTNEPLKKEIQRAVADGEYTKGLEMAVTGFLSEFRTATGNKAWSSISKHLLHLERLIQKVEESRSPNDALHLSTYLDTIDQLAHNTGSLMEKLVQREMGSVNPDAQQRYQELLRLRDISKMEGSRPTALLMQQHLVRMPKEYRDWYKRYLAMHQVHPESGSVAQPGHPTNEQWQYQQYLNRPVEEGDEYNAALELLNKTKRQRELANYLTVPDDSPTISSVSKKTPPPPPKPTPK
ncbi:hypothetical protein M0R72_00190 [Candidatus Pacearchaeota archaeon]|jgi:hypothetical protein|nr:hypothetical protein [Candidatus Pacearchaeota archaeon]